MSAPMIEARGLHKSFGDTHAVAGVDLTVEAGTILGFLGPNGAGKTSTVRILTTLSRPDAGTATVAGFDVVTQAPLVRRHIGATGQDATLDELLTGRQNLAMVAELSGLTRSDARTRAAELLEWFELAHAGDRIVKTYSGGMRRRLDLAASLVMKPPVLFFDEPTTGLDPVSRNRVWDVIRELVAEGSTVLLTTQYLDEADTLADRIAVIDHGKVIADGTSRELKAKIGGEQLEVTLSEAAPHAAASLDGLVTGDVHISDDGRRLRAAVRSGRGMVTEVVRALDAAGVLVDDVEIHRPSLDDVFFVLTGHAAEEAMPDETALEEVPA